MNEQPAETTGMLDAQAKAALERHAKSVLEGQGLKVTRAGRLGNMAQWVAAIGTALAAAATIATGVVAYIGLKQAQPFFRLQELEEETSQARMALRDLNTALSDARSRTWKFACQITVVRVVEPLRVDAKTATVGIKATLGEYIRSGGELPLWGWWPEEGDVDASVPTFIKGTVSRVDLSFLTPTERERLIALITAFVDSNRTALDLPRYFTRDPTTGIGDEDQYRTWGEKLSKAVEVLDQLRGACEKAAPT